MSVLSRAPFRMIRSRHERQNGPVQQDEKVQARIAEELRPDSHYEAWSIHGPDDLRFICLPGAGLSVLLRPQQPRLRDRPGCPDD
jgi:hypothetical protein